MVNSVRTTKNNHRIIEVEDDTGVTPVLVHKDNEKLFKLSEKIVNDEVIGVVGVRKGSLVIASEIINPGVPRKEDKEMDFSAVFISDIHIGSSTFLEDAFKRFTSWINGDYGDEEQREIANDVRYLVVAGDIVDGIGVYPHQEEELTIKDIYGQYEEAARLLGDINDVKMVIAPGNHDACRLAEPQPALPEHYAPELYKIKNTEFVSNPSVVSLDGINTLIYHGRSFDDFAMTIKGMSHERTDLIMKELLEKDILHQYMVREHPCIGIRGSLGYRRYSGRFPHRTRAYKCLQEVQGRSHDKLRNLPVADRVPEDSQHRADLCRGPCSEQGTMKLLKFN